MIPIERAESGVWVAIAIAVMVVISQLMKNKAASKSEPPSAAAIANKLQQKAIELDKARHQSFSEVKEPAQEKKGIAPYRMKDVSFSGIREETPLEAKRRLKKFDMRSIRNMDGTVLEDDEHDWLAGQLREEERAYRQVSAMFQLKMSHAANCNAEKLKNQHEMNCDAKQLKKDSLFFGQNY